MQEKGAPSEYLRESEYLSDEIGWHLVGYGEESEHIDFKESFNPSSAKAWIDLAVDCVAFANTVGGYVVFGVKNNTWERVGLTRETCNTLIDTKKVLEKINRGLTPSITAIRTRAIELEGKLFVIVGVPATLDRTHIFETNQEWNPSGKGAVTVVPKGAIYIRRAASNQVLTSVDFEQIIERRFRRIKEKILEGLTRVVEAPADHDVVTVVRTDTAGEQPGFLVKDAPESLELSGQRIQLASDSIVSVVEALRSVSTVRPDAPVHPGVLYAAYAERETAVFRKEQLEWLALYSLVEAAPAFFWLSRMPMPEARRVIEIAFARATWRKGSIVTFSGFYSKALHGELREKMKGPGCPNPFVSKERLMGVRASLDVSRDVALATVLARSLSKKSDAYEGSQLERVDCSLYAPFDS